MTVRDEINSESTMDWPVETVQELVDMVAADLERSVGVDDEGLNALAYSSQTEDVDDVRRHSVVCRTTSAPVAAWIGEQGIGAAHGPVRLPANGDLGMRARVCVPIRAAGALLGFLWLLDTPRRVSDEDLVIASAYAERIGAVLAHERLVRQHERASEVDLVRCLIQGDARPERAGRWLAPAAAYAVAVVQAGDPAGGRKELEGALRDALDETRRGSPPHRILTLVEEGEGVLIVAADDGEREIAARGEDVLAALESRLPASTVGIGLSRPRVDRGELGDAYREAAWGALAARRIRSRGPVAAWGSLGAYRTLFKLLGGRDPREMLPDALVRLLDAADAPTLLPTLETYLDTACDAKATAAALSVHRSSLYQRLRKIEQITGTELRSGDDRLNLHLGLRLLRLTRLEQAGRE